MIYTNFVETGIFTLEQVIDWMAVKPAEIFGLNAGTLTIGAPADIAVFDLATAAPIDAKHLNQWLSIHHLQGGQSKERHL